MQESNDLEKLLQGRVTESMVLRIGRSKFGSCLWLLSYPGKLKKSLSYVYRPDEKIMARDGFMPGQSFSAPGFLEAFLSYIKLIMAPDFILDEKKVEASKKHIRIESEVLEDGITMPLILDFAENNEEIAPEKIRFAPKTISDLPADIFIFPAERRAAGIMAGLLKSLEYTNDFGLFAELYDIASNIPCDGTLLFVSMKKALPEKEVDLTPGRRRCFDTFSSDRRMKKRWEQYKKRNELSVSWEELLSRLRVFFDPIFEAIASEEGSSFFGDWIPELGRYLDA